MSSNNGQVNIVGPFVSYIAASHSLFQHDALDLSRQTLRLVRVLPNLTRRGRVQCQLWHSTISAGEYRCISYTWGSDVVKYIINVNGKGFSVRENLWRFLNAARKHLPGQALWIDALCIDQETIKERNHQVQQMGMIFMNAKLTLIWISGMKDVFELLDDKHSSVPSTSTGFQDGLASLCENNYWRRVWIIQEMLLAKELVFMTELFFLDWMHFSDFILDRSGLGSNLKCTLMHLDEKIQQRIRKSYAVKLGQARTASSGQMYEMSLFDQLRNFGESQCSDIRDRVVGLLGLAYDFGPNATRLADYSGDTVKFFNLMMNFYTPSKGSILADVATLIQRLDLTPLQLPQIVSLPLQLGVKTASLLRTSSLTKAKILLQEMRERDDLPDDYLECSFCGESLAFTTFDDHKIRAPPIDMQEDFCVNGHEEKVCIYWRRLGDWRKFNGEHVEICCLASHGLSTHYAFVDSTPANCQARPRVYSQFPYGSFLPRHTTDTLLHYNWSNWSKEMHLTLLYPTENDATETHKDHLGDSLLLNDFPSQLLSDRSSLFQGHTEKQIDAFISRKDPRTILLQKSILDMLKSQSESLCLLESMFVNGTDHRVVLANLASQGLRFVEEFVMKPVMACTSEFNPTLALQSNLDPILTSKRV